MNNEKLHPDVIAFIGELEILQKILHDQNEWFWFDHLTKIISLARRSDARSAGSFLVLFGGAGSFGDLRLGDDFEQVRNRAYALAEQLLKSV